MRTTSESKNLSGFVIKLMATEKRDSSGLFVQERIIESWKILLALSCKVKNQA